MFSSVFYLSCFFWKGTGGGLVLLLVDYGVSRHYGHVAVKVQLFAVLFDEVVRQ